MLSQSPHVSSKLTPTQPNFSNGFCLFVFEIGSHSTAQAGLKLSLVSAFCEPLPSLKKKKKKYF